MKVRSTPKAGLASFWTWPVWWNPASTARWSAAAALCAFGAVLLCAPSFVANHANLRLAHEGRELSSAISVLRAVGTSCVILGVVASVFQHLGIRSQMVFAIAAYLPLTLVFADWHVDDAAISYAYAENLVRGHGLVLHATQAPEEAYSNLLWLLLLAGLRALGADVAAAAKVLGTVVGASAIALCLACVQRSAGRTLRGPAFAVVVATFCTSPFVIWSVSGLEHGLQALISLGVVFCATQPGGALGPTALLASALMLVRPEAPLIVAALWLVLAFEEFRASGAVRAVVARLWPVALVPFATLAGLLIFRLFYFGDPLPNPYYAKASDATFVRLGNPFGAGWRYVIEWLVQGSGFLLAAPLCTLAQSGASRAVRVALALLFAQLAFAVYAGGDWMGQWRFLATPIALLAFLAGHAVEREDARRSPIAGRYAALTAGAVIVSTVPLLAQFRAHPTTPYADVAEIGGQFVALADRLGIERPLLAHHDAGGTSYRARIELLDLAGLGHRRIAKGLNDPEFLRRYILEQRRPDFIFGTTTAFAAAASRFHETELFARDYVRLEVDHPLLAQGQLCHVRRDRVRDAPGVIVEREAGVAKRVLVTRLTSAKQ